MHTMRPVLSAAALVYVLASIAGCAFEAPRRLPVERFLAESVGQRKDLSLSRGDSLRVEAWVPDRSWTQDSPLLANLLSRLLVRNPEIRAARRRLGAELIAWKGAGLLEDPEIEMGLAADHKFRLGGSAGISITLPLSSRLSRSRALAAAKVKEALTDLKAVEREQALALRRAFALAMSAAGAVEIHSENLDWARKGEALARRVARGGGASAVDVYLLASEERAARLALMEARHEKITAREEVAALLGLEVAALPVIPTAAGSLPAVPSGLEKRVREKILETSPELLRLAAAFGVAAQALGLERAARWPDLTVGLEAQAEPGAMDEVGLSMPFSLSLPLWNRNSGASAEAKAEVARCRGAYREALNRILADLDAFLAAQTRLGDRLRLLDHEILPAHRKALDLAREAMAVSDFDSFRYVELQRYYRELLTQRWALLPEIIKGRSDIEVLVGELLFPLPLAKPKARKEKK
jgi:cobalt-zinc-cadmium efflux system outer membrane protein